MRSAAATMSSTWSGRSTGAGSNVPGHDRDAGGLRVAPSRELVTQRVDGVGVRADEDETRLGHGPGERRALRQESVAGVDRFRAGRQRRVDDPVRAQVAVRGGCRSEADRRVRRAHMGRIGVRIRIHRDGLDAEVATGPDDAQRDLATVGDEDPSEWRPGPVFAQGQLGAPGRRRHSGMLPCFFGGFVSRLSRSISSAAMSRGRVSDGRMTSST